MEQARAVFRIELLLPNQETRSIEVSAEEHIWDAASKAGLVFPLVYLPEDRQAGFVLLCTGKPRANLRIRTHQAKQMREFPKHKKLLVPYSWSTE
jgi:hypothetical protein